MRPQRMLHPEDNAMTKATGDHGSAEAKRKLTAAERKRKVLELRLKGLDFRTIAQRVGYANPGTAHRAYTSALQDIPKAAADELRTTELARYDQAQLLIMRKIRKGDLDAVHALIRLSDQRAKLTGLYTEQTQTEHVEVTVALQAFLATAQDEADADDEADAADHPDDDHAHGDDAVDSAA